MGYRIIGLFDLSYDPPLLQYNAFDWQRTTLDMGGHSSAVYHYRLAVHSEHVGNL